MNNLASVDKIMLKPGELIPCIKVLRGIDIASKQQGAKFVFQLSFTYNDASGRAVTTPTVTVPLNKTTGVESRDPMWAEVMAPAITLSVAPDPNSRFTCNATVTITGVSGLVTPCSDLDTQILTPS